MQTLLRLAGGIDRLNEGVGRAASWLSLLMVLIGAFNAIVRYLGRFMGQNLSSNVYLEGQWYLFSLLFLLGAAYTLKNNGHVRVDVVYARLSERGRAWIDLFGSVLFLLPFTVVSLLLTWPSVRNSWHVLELSPDPGGLPRYPLKTVILICFFLLFLQGLSLLIRQIGFLSGRTDDRLGIGPVNDGAGGSTGTGMGGHGHGEGI